MLSSAEVEEQLAVMADALAAIATCDWASFLVADRLQVMLGLETQRRTELAVSCQIGATLNDVAPGVLGETPKNLIANHLRLDPKESWRRLQYHELLTDRATLIGEPLPPQLPAMAAAWRAGQIDAAHLAVVQRFFREIPRATPDAERDKAEQFLATHARTMRPDELTVLATKLAVTINPDGNFSDEDRVAKSSFTWGPQRPDGMSTGTLIASPALRAGLDAYLEKHAAPGMCLPDQPDTRPADPDAQPADPDAASRDVRSRGQRNHDALWQLVRSTLGNPDLGTHRGLPVAIIATADLHALHTATGSAITATGTSIPVSDLVRLLDQGQAQPYLLLFEHNTQIPLHFLKADRCATQGQRLALFAMQRGCTFPRCHRPAIHSEAHHHKPWAIHHRTNINDLTWACWEHHPLVGPGGWTNSIDDHGIVHWHPPAHYPRNTPTTNNFHHPEHWLDDDWPKKPDPKDDDVG